MPVAIHGSSSVRNWKRLQFPKVTVQYGDPFRYERVAEPTREQQQATADEIFDAIKVLYDGLEAHGRAGGVARARASGAPRRAKRTASRVIAHRCRARRLDRVVRCPILLALPVAGAVALAGAAAPRP